MDRAGFGADSRVVFSACPVHEGPPGTLDRGIHEGFCSEGYQEQIITGR